MTSERIQTWFPWTTAPVIANGPMIGAACPKLAAEVTLAGGIGFIPSTVFLDGHPTKSEDVGQLDADLTEARRLLGDAPTSPLRVGAAFLTGHKSITSFTRNALPVLKKHRPSAVWLFAPDENVKPHRTIIEALRTAYEPRPRVFVQVGNVTAAKEAIADGADVVVCQGIDAGGHQFRRGMGVVTFLAEVRRFVEEEVDGTGREVCLFGAGGIADGKGVAAAMTLEADGVVMGTRFTVAKESIYPEFRKQLVLQTSDGGSNTLKSPFNDQINNSALWGPLYDGRAIIGPIHEKFLAGASFYDCYRSLQDDHSPEEAKKVINTWAGTGVGLVRKAQPVGDIIREVREEAKQTIQKVASRFQ